MQLNTPEYVLRVSKGFDIFLDRPGVAVGGMHVPGMYVPVDSRHKVTGEPEFLRGRERARKTIYSYLFFYIPGAR